MAKSGFQNDIEAKNNSIAQNGRVFLDNLSVNEESFYKKNDIKPKNSAYGNNLKTARKIEKVKKKSETLADMLKKIAVIAAAGTTGVVGVGAVLPPPVTAEIQFLEGFDNEVFYAVGLDEFKDGVKIVLYNDFTNREQTMEKQFAEGVFENLQTNMQYTFVVKYGSKVIAKQTIVTKTEEQTSDDPNGNDPQNGYNG